MPKYWAQGISDEALDDIHLDGNAQLEKQSKSSRPACLRGPIHEIFLVLVASLVGATFLFLQRAMMVLTDTLRHSLWQEMSTVVWMIASPGYVYWYLVQV